MAKPLKFYQTLNQAPKGPKHGKHRRASASSHRNPIVGTDHSAGGADQNATFYITYSSGSSWYSWGAPEPAVPRAIPYAGVRTGELIGTRAWYVINNHDLRSLAHHFIWQPGEAVEGKIDEIADSSIWATIMGGVYSHFDMGLTMADVCESWDARRYPHRSVREMPSMKGLSQFFVPGDILGDEWAIADDYIGMAAGRVKLWGEVVEHERGYRAQYAKIISIDEVCGGVDIEKLRAKYMLVKET